MVEVQEEKLLSRLEHFMCQAEVLSPPFPQLSRSQRDTLLQGTFNVTLNSPLSGDQTQLETAAKKQTFVLGV